MAMSVTEALAITPAEAAEKLGVSRATFYNYVKAGKIPTVRFGNRILVPVKALERMMDVEPQQPEAR